jgi:membrane-associated phospholipid phosphatase
MCLKKFFSLLLAMPTIASMIRSIPYIFLFLCALNFNTLAQESAASASPYRLFVSDANIALQDGLSYWSVPTRFSGRDWLITGGAAAGLVGVVSADNYLCRKFSVETDDQLPGSPWEIPTDYGELPYASIFSAGLYAAGLVSGDNDIRVTGRLAFESLAFSGSAVLLLRYVSGRTGPGPGGNSRDFKLFNWDAERQSFPSGHSVISFALSTVLAERIDNTFARIGLYGMASLTAYSRVRFTQHWASDVLAGSALGIATGLFVISREEDREGKSGKHEGLSITPTANGLRLLYAF